MQQREPSAPLDRWAGSDKVDPHLAQVFAVMDITAEC